MLRPTVTLAFALLCGASSAQCQTTSPLLALLPQFAAPNVPALGPAEPGPTPRTWPDPTTVPGLPGRGLSQHPMLYAGEGYNTIFLVNQGKVIWTYSTGRGGEIDYVWLPSNRHVLLPRPLHSAEVGRAPGCTPAI